MERENGGYLRKPEANGGDHGAVDDWRLSAGCGW
jgi:hypothetical protein